ncbi:MEMO1 family [Lophiotrema nucula]|uniref:MEMO1 family n=1 Tax=Lophiotrema nucula TaxID=690887 RepID=A0A6A5YW78_9PLEO|nr:MEMO1 family [Lophiotrema nucula]
MATRDAAHAGSWYTDSKSRLSSQLDEWLDAVPAETTPIGTQSSQQGQVSIPTKGARAIIAPHAGYSYSGPAAAWAYKAVDWANAKRVFLLGPSHHYYLTGAATTDFEYYATPLGNLTVDTKLADEIAKSWGLEKMPADVDEAEHSLEMQLPYIYKMLSLNYSSHSSFPTLIPIMVGNTTPAKERDYGRLLAPYLSDPSNIFVISSDFCHWGSRFRYTYYQPSSPSASPQNLRSSSAVPSSWPIHKSIAAVDQESMDAVETGSHEEFVGQLERTGNTVCGRHPIGVFMAAVEAAEGMQEGSGVFRFVRYERSGLVESVRDSSVSYASAFAVF